MYEFFAITAPGLAPLCAQELVALGLTPGAPDDAGVAFQGTMGDGRRANLWLRTASRVVRRLAEFEAKGFPELERRARKVIWKDVLLPGTAVALRVTCKKSKLYHSGAVAQRIEEAISAAFGSPVRVRTAAADEDAPEDDLAQLIVVRLFRDQCTISVDMSGALLHRRGYRLATAKAPMRETLAAATLLAAGYDGSGPLIDPLCGSGTIPIEAAMIARHMAPGLGRHFAFERWPGHEKAAWKSERDAARSLVLPKAPFPIVASDRDEGAITATQANAERAGVGTDVSAHMAPISAMALPTGLGWVVSNPPYGVRVGEAKGLRDLYAAFGQLLRAQAPGWHMGLIAAQPALVAQLKLPLKNLLKTSNGGIPVQILAGDIPQG